MAATAICGEGGVSISRVGSAALACSAHVFTMLCTSAHIRHRYRLQSGAAFITDLHVPLSPPLPDRRSTANGRSNVCLEVVGTGGTGDTTKLDNWPLTLLQNSSVIVHLGETPRSTERIASLLITS